MPAIVGIAQQVVGAPHQRRSVAQAVGEETTVRISSPEGDGPGPLRDRQRHFPAHPSVGRLEEAHLAVGGEERPELVVALQGESLDARGRIVRHRPGRRRGDRRRTQQRNDLVEEIEEDEGQREDDPQAADGHADGGEAVLQGPPRLQARLSLLGREATRPCLLLFSDAAGCCFAHDAPFHL